MAANNRSEKLVIYSSNYHFRYYLDLLNQIKQIHPKLFEGSEKNNPFMPTIDGFAYANQPLTDHYTLLDGSTIQISKTPNSFISQTIEENTLI